MREKFRFALVVGVCAAVIWAAMLLEEYNIKQAQQKGDKPMQYKVILAVTLEAPRKNAIVYRKEICLPFPPVGGITLRLQRIDNAELRYEIKNIVYDIGKEQFEGMHYMLVEDRDYDMNKQFLEASGFKAAEE